MKLDLRFPSFIAALSAVADGSRLLDVVNCIGAILLLHVDGGMSTAQAR